MTRVTYQSRNGGRRQGNTSARVAGATLAAIVLAAAAAGRGQAVPPAASPPPPATLPGSWHTFANGDDVLALLSDGPFLWAGTRAGGLVRWQPSSGRFTQFLAPQTPIGGNTVHAIAKSPLGGLWLATSGGLTFFDDRGTLDQADDVWRTYTVADSFGGLPSDDVRALAIQDHTLWVGGAQVWDSVASEWRGGGLGQLDTAGTRRTDDDSWAPVTTFASSQRTAPDGTVTLGLVSDNINDLAVALDGGLWVATSSHMKLEYQADLTKPRTWQQVHGGLSHVDAKGTLATNDDVWSPRSCEDPWLDSSGRPLVACSMGALAVDRQGRLWTAPGGMGVVAMPGNRGVSTGGQTWRFERADGLGASFVEHIDASQEGTVWFATRGGGVRGLTHGGTMRNKADDVWQAFGPAEGLTRDRVQAVRADGAHVWAGMGPALGVGGGVARIDTVGGVIAPSLVTAGPGRTGLPSNFITSLAMGQEDTRWAGHVWIGLGSQGQRLFGAGAVDLDTNGSPHVDDDVWTVYTAPGTDDDGQPPYTGLAGQNVQTVLTTGDQVWFGVAEAAWNATTRRYDDGGLSAFDGERWTTRTLASTGGPTAGLRHNSISALTEACNGDLWIGTGSRWTEGMGVSVLELGAGATPHVPGSDTWRLYEFPALASNEVASIAADCAGGRMWAASTHHARNSLWSDGGLARLDVLTEEWARFDKTTGLESYSAGRIRGEALEVAVGPDGSIWIGTYGTRAMTEGQLIGTAPYWPAVVNRWNEGVWSAEVFAGLGWISALAVEPGGRLWAATSRGGSARDSVEPEGWRVDRTLPGLLVYEEAVGWRSLDVATGGLPDNDVSAVAIAADGAVWVGTQGSGLARYRPDGDAPTPTPTNDAPSPTPSSTPSRTPTREATPTGSTSTGTVSPTATGTVPTRTPTIREHRIFLPTCHQLRRG